MLLKVLKYHLQYFLKFQNLKILDETSFDTKFVCFPLFQPPPHKIIAGFFLHNPDKNCNY